jgi:hypothetical protein
MMTNSGDGCGNSEPKRSKMKQNEAKDTTSWVSITLSYVSNCPILPWHELKIDVWS